MPDDPQAAGARPLAVVTGASSGIGLELARCAAQDGCDLVICAQDDAIEEAARELRLLGAAVEAVRADLSTEAGVLLLWERVGAREVDYLCANAGVALGDAFVEEEWARIDAMLKLNVVGTTLLLHRALPRMLTRTQGRILVTGSIAGFVPGAFMAVYNATKAYLDSLSYAVREEIKDFGGDVTITCLMPGLTDTPVFERADMMDTPVGKAGSLVKSDPADVARAGWEAMKAGKAGVTPGLVNKLITTFAGIIPDTILAQLNRLQAEPADGKS